MAHTGFVQTASGGQVENVTHTTPAGGAISTLGDYGRFLEMIVHDCVAPDGTRILEAATVAEMQENQIEGAEYMTASAFRVERESPYGLGEWLDWTDENGEALVLSSDGAFGFRPWIDKVNDLYGVYLIVDTGDGAREGVGDGVANGDGGPSGMMIGWIGASSTGVAVGRRVCFTCGTGVSIGCGVAVANAGSVSVANGWVGVSVGSGSVGVPAGARSVGVSVGNGVGVYVGVGCGELGSGVKVGGDTWKRNAWPPAVVPR